MEGLITFEKLINVEDKINELVNEHNTKNILLNEFSTSKYNIIECKRKIFIIIYKFKATQYLFETRLEDNIHLGKNYELKPEAFIRKFQSSSAEQFIDKKYDGLIYSTNIYYSILNLGYKYTKNEEIYFINTFFREKPLSEEKISELLSISRTNLQKIKASCIVKCWIELEKYDDENDL